jgi:hypothetical protein
LVPVAPRQGCRYGLSGDLRKGAKEAGCLYYPFPKTGPETVLREPS